MKSRCQMVIEALNQFSDPVGLWQVAAEMPKIGRRSIEQTLRVLIRHGVVQRSEKGADGCPDSKWDGKRTTGYKFVGDYQQCMLHYGDRKYFSAPVRKKTAEKKRLDAARLKHDQRHQDVRIELSPAYNQQMRAYAIPALNRAIEVEESPIYRDALLCVRRSVEQSLRSTERMPG